MISPHVDRHVDRLALLSEWAVLLVPARNSAPTIIHKAAEVPTSWGARPVLVTTIHRALGAILIRNTESGNNKHTSDVLNT